MVPSTIVSSFVTSPATDLQSGESSATQRRSRDRQIAGAASMSEHCLFVVHVMPPSIRGGVTAGAEHRPPLHTEAANAPPRDWQSPSLSHCDADDSRRSEHAVAPRSSAAGLHDVRVVEAHREPRLVEEHRGVLVIGRARSLEDDELLRVEGPLREREIDVGHSARPESIEQRVTAEAGERPLMGHLRRCLGFFRPHGPIVSDRSESPTKSHAREGGLRQLRTVCAAPEPNGARRRSRAQRQSARSSLQ